MHSTFVCCEQQRSNGLTFEKRMMTMNIAYEKKCDEVKKMMSDGER